MPTVLLIYLFILVSLFLLWISHSVFFRATSRRRSRRLDSGGLHRPTVFVSTPNTTIDRIPSKTNPTLVDGPSLSAHSKTNVTGVRILGNEHPSTKTPTPLVELRIEKTPVIVSERMMIPKPIEVDVHFQMCGGMFNMHWGIIAALWLTAKASALLGKDRAVRLFMPAIANSIMGGWYLNFDAFYDFEALKRSFPTLEFAQETAESNQRVDYGKICPDPKRDGFHVYGFHSSVLPNALHDAVMKNTDHCVVFDNCVLYVLPFNYGRYPKQRLSPVESEQLAVVNSIRFHPRFYALADRAAKALPPTFYAIHLRVETDYVRTFKQASVTLNGTALDECLIKTHGLNPDVISTLYVSGGTTIWQYPEIQRWRTQSPFKIVNRADLFASETSKLGREEWGIVEALVCVHAERYAGMWDSSRSMFVMRTRMNSTEAQDPAMFLSHRDFAWDKHCPNVFGDRLNETDYLGRMRREYIL